MITPDILGRLVLRWLAFWLVLFVWWYVMASLFNAGHPWAALAVGVGVPAAFVGASLVGASRGSSPEEDEG